MADSWYYTRNNQQQGPVPLGELQGLYASGQVGPADMVWGDGLAAWQRASATPQVAGAGASDAAAVQSLAEAAQSVGTLSYSMPQQESLIFTPRAMDMLRQTKPWARLIGVMILIAAALMIGIALIGLIATSALGGRGGPQAMVLLIYIPISLLYIMPGLYLNRYASRIGELMRLKRADVLESTLEAQKSFWKFVGIVTLVVIGIYILVIAIVVLVAAMR